MKANHLITGILFLFVITSCGREAKEHAAADSMEYSAETKTETEPAGNSEADTVRQFIRTADLDFKVQNVEEATFFIEKAVLTSGGFITKSALSDGEGYTHTVQTGPDSSAAITHFTMANSMTVRVPNQSLDKFLLTVNVLATHLKKRTITADEVSAEFLANKKADIRAKEYAKRIRTAIDQKGRKLDDIVDAETVLSEGQKEADEVNLNNVYLRDKVDYSTVTLYIHENPSVITEKLYSPPAVLPYEPPFSDKLKESLVFGWSILENIVLFLVKIWTLILLALLILFVMKKPIWGFQIKVQKNN